MALVSNCMAGLVINAAHAFQGPRGGLSALPVSPAVRRVRLALTGRANIGRVTCQASGVDTADVAPERRVFGTFFSKNSSSSSFPLAKTDDGSKAAGDSSGGLTSAIMESLGKCWKPLLVSLAIAAVLWYTPGDAMAANSGGRAGGNAFSSSRARSYSAPSQSYSRGGYSGPSYVAPAPSFSAPFFFAPSPFFSPFPFFGPTVVVGGGGGGGGLFSFIMFSVVAFFVVSAILNFFQPSEEEVWEASQRSSVVRLQVGLMGSARQLQKDLERMALRADTSTPEGLHYVLQEAVLSLLRNPDYCIYGYSTSEVTRDSYEGEQAFNRLSMEERSKFKEETLVNVGDVRRRAEKTPAFDRIGSEYIVVTIIAATEGEFRLPEIRSGSDLRTALTELGSITADDLQAVEILWTPENEEDTLTTKDMLQDYPLLRPL